MIQSIGDIIKTFKESVQPNNSMNLDQYVQDATRTESIIKEVQTDPEYLRIALLDFIEASKRLDDIKKHVFYGKPIGDLTYYNLEETINVDPRLFHALIGIITEAAEIAELLLKISIEEEEVPSEKIADELGDINWYEAIASDVLHVPLSDILRANIAKLKARFPEKFTSENAITRNLAHEENVHSDSLNEKGDEGC